MKTRLKFLVPILAFGILLTSFTTNNTVKDPEKDKVIIYVLKNILTRGHFVQKDLNDDFSEKVYNSFIDGLDPSKRYFTQEDLKEFSQYKYQIDNQLKQNNVDFYNLVYDRFLEKIKSAKQYYGVLLAQPFNYNKNESINVDYDESEFAKNENQLIDYWRKQLKLQVLGRIQNAENQEKEKVKKDKKFKKNSFKTLEKKARTEVLKNMDELYLRIEELEHNDWFSTFLNSVVNAFDPHTTYMSPRVKTNFDQTMSGKLEGIGARLQPDGIYTKVFELVSGGPAWKQGDLEAGDIILKVAQGDEKPFRYCRYAFI